MKKVIFLQNEGNVIGGVWFVNKTIAEELIKKGYDVSIISLRKYHKESNISCSEKINLLTINEIDDWNILHTIDIKKSSNKIKTLFKFIIQHFKYYKDIKKSKKYIRKLKPDYIIATHYQMLEAIPKDYLAKTIYEQHSSFEYALSQRKNFDYLLKFNNKIKFVWLSKKSMQKAISYGLVNNYYIYNPSRIDDATLKNIKKSKKLITVSRIDNDIKRIDLMIQICEELFKNKQFSEWSLEIYGDGEDRKKLEKAIINKKQIVFKGVVNNPEKVLCNSSIYLNTSKTEGYSMSIIEAYACGIPVVSFNFGESAEEQVINNKTGYLVNSKEEYIDRLKELMTDNDKLNLFSKQAYEYYIKYNRKDVVVNKWINLFKNIDKGDNYD